MSRCLLQPTYRRLAPSSPAVLHQCSVCPAQPHLQLYSQQDHQSLHHGRRSSTFAHLHAEMTARTLPPVYDYFSPVHSHLLNVSLADYLPSIPSSASDSTASKRAPRAVPSTTPQQPNLLPAAHHLIYFPPPIPGRDLLPDGTDPLQSPGDPFTRRMWAGGRVRFLNTASAQSLLALDGQRAVCVEGIRDVSVKGQAGAEKIFVGVERRVGRCAEGEDETALRGRLWTADEDSFGHAALVERRNIVFMRDGQNVTSASAGGAKKKEDAGKKGPPLRPTHAPDYEHRFVPDARLLFRYSALTYNAHAIHLNPEYCREVEGHRERLVHGPLSFTAALTLLRFHLVGLQGRGQAQGKEEVVREIEYRNLAPLYCGEPVRVCGRKVEDGKWEVWVETPEGGYALRGTARTEVIDQGQGVCGDVVMNTA